jgi:hypothetical protein
MIIWNKMKRSEAILERIIENHINQLEQKTQPIEYKIILYKYALKFMRVASHYDKHIWAGAIMSRLYSVANELDGVDSNWREVSRRIK